ncbi:MAG TPA: DUF6259 domain-containing protein [bacterium]|nr:DUF6259 domain-containing protein [bacterium]HQL62328.1 DUF6259 domain-containing protein [bacterium]
MRRVRIFLSVIVVFLICPAVGISAASVAFPLFTQDGRLVFEEQDGRVSLGKVETIYPEGKRAWVLSKPDVPLWTITLLDDSGSKRTVTALQGTGTVRALSQREIQLGWKGVQPGGLNVLADISVDAETVTWKLKVEATEEGFTLFDVVYPEIGPLAVQENMYSVEPWGWGVVRKDFLSRHDERTYPGAAQAMPFLAVSDGTSGLYLGTHDREGYSMHFIIGRHENEEAATFAIRHDVEGMGIAKKYSLPYSVVTVPFRGGWYEAGRIYRKAAMDTPWGGIPPLAERKDIPEWMKATDLWYIGSCHDDATADQAIKFAQFFNVPTAAHIYTWHEIPFDDHYPEYFPAKPGFKAAIQKIQKAGIPAMPYINGRLWDPATESWKEKNAQTACSLNEKGEKYVEVYGSKVPLSPMCPYTELWQNTVRDLVDRLVNEVGVKAVYIDQISAASAKRCFAKNHGHPIGGGTYWIQGYRQLLKKCLKCLPHDAALTTEENADPWNDLLHAWLMVNTQERGGEIVPLYPAVYGGRAISFGFQYILGNDLPDRYPFRLKMARAFVFGSQLGWVGAGVLDPKHQDEAEFLKRLCEVRHSAREALQYGELLAPVILESGGTVSWKYKDGGKEIESTQPAVVASAWLTPEGKRILALANVADDARTVTLTLDRRHFGGNTAKTATFRRMPTGETTPLKEDTGKWSGAVTLDARDAIVLEIL